MKTLALISLLLLSLPASAELQALNGEELESELTISNITAFQHSTAPVATPDLGSIPRDEDFRIQLELNALRLTGPIDSSAPVRLENQILQGPSSGVEVINSQQLNF